MYKSTRVQEFSVCQTRQILGAALLIMRIFSFEYFFYMELYKYAQEMTRLTLDRSHMSDFGSCFKLFSKITVDYS